MLVPSCDHAASLRDSQGATHGMITWGRRVTAASSPLCPICSWRASDSWTITRPSVPHSGAMS